MSNETESAYEKKGHELRAKIKAVAAEVKEFIQLSRETTPANGDDSVRQNHGEMIDNAILSYRHLETAAMRVGKCLQADQGGVSILDKMRDEQPVGGAPTAGDASDAGCDECCDSDE